MAATVTGAATGVLRGGRGIDAASMRATTGAALADAAADAADAAPADDADDADDADAAGRAARGSGLPASSSGATRSTKRARPAVSTPPVYSPAIGNTSLPWIRVCRSARRSTVFSACSMKSGCPSSTSSTARLPAQNPVTSSSTSG